MLKILLLVSVFGLSISTPVSEEESSRKWERCGYESCHKADPNILNVHIVPHTHDDVGWLKTVDQYYYGSRNNIQKAGVQYIIDSVVKELWEDPRRRFIYVETAFFWKWWTRQPDSIRHKVHTLVRQGRLQFVGGAWSMNDEAATHYQSTIDQFTWGLRKLNETFGACGMPRVGWQIDPFGHAREFASLLAAMGYDGLFLGRIDYQDKRQRLMTKTMEMLWRGDDDLGPPSDIFTGILFNTYSPPPGFCFDVLCSDEPIIDDPASPLYNVDARISRFLDYVLLAQSKYYRSNNVILTMGGDFTYQDATMWYKNLDKLILYANLKAAKEGLKLKLFYSTPDCYLKAVKDSNPTLPTKQDDFFPYASDPTAFWTGYFTSRPTTKYFEREGNNILQAMKQQQVLANLEEHNMFPLNELKSAMGVWQHHDAVTGTEKQHVTQDYERLLDQAVEDVLIIANQAINKFMQGDAPTAPGLKFERCHYNESRCQVSENSQQFIVSVYNPVGWSLEAVPVRLPVPGGEYIVVAPDGEEIASQLVELPAQVTAIPSRDSKATHEVVFLAYNVPGMGYKNFYVKKKDSNKVKRDAAFNEDLPHQSKRKHEYYDNINNYWKDIKDKIYVDIKNIEENGMYETNLKPNINFGRHYAKTNEKIPDQPILKKGLVEKVNKDLDMSYSANVDIMRDRNEDTLNMDIEELEKIIIEAKRQLNMLSNSKRMMEKNVKYPTLNDEEMRMLSDDPMVVQRYNDEMVLENEKLRLRMNFSTGQTHIILSDGTELPFSIRMSYYPGCYGNNRNYANRSSGAYIFRPNATKPIDLIKNDTKFVKGTVVDEIHYTSAEFASGVIRTYKHSKLNYIEHEWLVGPIPIDDNVGKEIIVRYATDIVNNGVFYTDSNGRQMLKRRLNQRPQWNLTLEEPIAGNYYPITNKIYIENDNRIAILTDRAQGGSSLVEGNIEIMLHRRLLHDDAFGVDEALNETVKGVGLIVRGKHKIVASKANDKDAIIDEKKKVLENHLQPINFVSDAKNLDLTTWLTMKNKHGGIKTSLPNGIHILTLEPWNRSKLLLRLENYLEKSDRHDTNLDVVLSELFNNIKITSMTETTLSANQYISHYNKWTWNKENDFARSFNEEYGNFEKIQKAMDNVENYERDDGFKIVLQAKQIRTFILGFKIK